MLTDALPGVSALVPTGAFEFCALLHRTGNGVWSLFAVETARLFMERKALMTGNEGFFFLPLLNEWAVVRDSMNSE